MPGWMMVALVVGAVAVIVLMILIGFSSSRRRKQHGFNVLPGEKSSKLVPKPRVK